MLWSRFRGQHHAIGVISDGEVFVGIDGRAVDGCKGAGDAGWRSKNCKCLSHLRLEFIDQLNVQRALQADGTGYGELTVLGSGVGAADLDVHDASGELRVIVGERNGGGFLDAVADDERRRTARGVADRDISVKASRAFKRPATNVDQSASGNRQRSIHGGRAARLVVIRGGPSDGKRARLSDGQGACVAEQAFSSKVLAVPAGEGDVGRVVDDGGVVKLKRATDVVGPARQSLGYEIEVGELSSGNLQGAGWFQWCSRRKRARIPESVACAGADDERIALVSDNGPLRAVGQG